jgi:indolepyruvate ferredoxin oxidoreductase
MTSQVDNITLEDCYRRQDGRVHLTGTQALVRMLLEQSALDRRRGLRTAAFVSGYPGSPLGGLDREIVAAAKYVEPAGIVFRPGVNEELAATAVAGTQLLAELPGRDVDGVVGFWYGKNPGLDRAADAIRHATISGTAHLGGAVAIIGDDPMCKSSTLPSSAEAMCRSLLLPLFVPSTIREIVELGLHAVALSRASGMWTGLKVVSDLADASAIVPIAGWADDIPLPPGSSRGRGPVLLAPTSVRAEHDLFTTRLARVAEYSRASGINRVTFEPAQARLGIVAAGATHAALQRALRELGLDDSELDRHGVRLIQLRMTWPITLADARELTAGLDEVLVIEDKLAFIESQLKELLYAEPDGPRVIGKRDAAGTELVSSYGAVNADHIAGVLRRTLALPHPDPNVARAPSAGADLTLLPVLPQRTPFFCSGCPHNISTQAAPDALVGGGIGCHALIALDPSGARGNIVGAPQMGGEGAHWIGLAPFTRDRHFIQNLGDGTFHHSGSLAIRASVAAGVNVTYKLLYNDAVAMTGGQQPVGRMTVADLTRWLTLEGVTRVVITCADPGGYSAAGLEPGTEVRSRDGLDVVSEELALVPGVTVIIHDDRCATEERRMRKRGLLPVVTERPWINERVCEGCGDCSAKSTCVSLQPVPTLFGTRTRIDQSSCNTDMSCLKGDCPSFVMVTPSRGSHHRPALKPPESLPEPVSQLNATSTLIRMPGIGGTGVVTLSQILQVAANIDGKWAAGLDQTGLAQKGGAVLSDVRIADAPITDAVRATAGSIDVLLGLDSLGAAASDTALACDPKRTVAIVNTAVVPTASMIVGPRETVAPDAVVRAIETVTRHQDNLYLDAVGLSDSLLGSQLAANTMLLGAAFQHGCIPISRAALRRAIELNDSAVELNLAAFEWGRAVVAAPDAVLAANNRGELVPVPSHRSAELVSRADVPPTVRDLLAVRTADLIDYQNERYARRYVAAVAEVAARITRSPAASSPQADEIVSRYARGLHRLMAYKDEYEVARLHLLPAQRARLAAEFGPDARARIMLHPPLLRALGLRRKIGFGSWSVPVLRVLKSGRRLRGTPADPFGWARVRRVERSVINDYRRYVTEALDTLTPETVDDALAVTDLAELVRGYESIKLASVTRFHAEADRLRARRRPPTRG